MTIRLRPCKAPTLPHAFGDYSTQYFDSLNNLLRLYFNQIDNVAEGLLSSIGLTYLRAPYGCISATTTQSAAADTPTVIIFDTVLSSSDVNIDAVIASRIAVVNAGIYNLQYTVQAVNTAAATDDVEVWVRLNGVDILNTLRSVGVPAVHSAINGHAVVNGALVLSLNAEDYIELAWTTDAGTSSVYYYPPSGAPVHPAGPSAILTLTYISAPLT